jgi:hypothetical protein
MVSINQHGLEVARRCYSGEELEKALQKRCHRLKNSMNRKDQSFKLYWTTDRPWLRYNEHEQMMYCTYCEKQFKDKTGAGK